MFSPSSLSKEEYQTVPSKRAVGIGVAIGISLIVVGFIAMLTSTSGSMQFIAGTTTVMGGGLLVVGLPLMRTRRK